MFKPLVVALGLVSLGNVVHGQTTISVSATASHPIPTTLWGQMFEDINHSGEGGLYAELLQNRAFQHVAPGSPNALQGWQPINGASISVVRESNPVSGALPNALKLTVPPRKSGPVGFANTGFFNAMKVTSGATYTASFYYRFPAASQFNGNVVVGLKSNTGQVLASATTAVSGGQTSWKQVTVTLKPMITPGSNSNLFTITLDGSAASGQTVHFAMLSLFPPTFKNRPNGMRVDIATALAEMGPSFFRLPGGNNIEGQTVATRWQWNATVGPLVNRPGRPGDWGYVNTDGLGLYEYLTYCEDLNMKPIMAVWAGYALGGTSVPESQLGPYIQQAIDQINFVVGDPSKSAPAALRAKLGHPQPFNLRYVEIGNEDFAAPDTYVYRWRVFASALKANFPNIHFIATTYLNNPRLSPNPTEYDVHMYGVPDRFAQNSFHFDGYQRNGQKYLVGEYAVISTNPNDVFGRPGNGRLTLPTMLSAAAEAAFMTGLERNSDIVFAAAYAPVLGHISNTQWTPNLLTFDAGNVYRSTSYYVQKLFSFNRGDEYLPSTLPSRTGTLYWSVVRQKSNNQIIIKVANIATRPQSMTFKFPFNTVSPTGSVEILTGNPSGSNTPANPRQYFPAKSSINTGKTFTFNAPPVSVAIITVTAR